MIRSNIFLYIVVFILVLSSCKDMNLKPLTQGSSESWYTTEEELDMAVNEFYLIGYWRDPLENSEQWTDNYTYRNLHRSDILYGTLSGSTGEVFRLWEQNYKLIARANSLLSKISNAEAAGVSPDMIKQYKAEAYFARAAKYAELLSYYGDVPYVEPNISIKDAFDKGRMEKDKLIPLIYADFDQAITDLPVSYGKNIQRFTKGAALALKARFALYMSDWKVAAEAAKACIDLGVYDLHNDFSDLFLATTKNKTKETIFSIPRSIAHNILLDQWIVNNELTRNPGGYGSSSPSWDLFASFLCTDGLPIDESPLFDSKNPFQNRDPRCAKTIVEFGTVHVGFDFDPHPEVLQVMNHKTGKIQDNNDNRAINQYASFNALNWKKGIDETWTQNGKKVDRDYLVIRYADVLLMYAEAKVELNEIDESVVEAMNKVRARGYDVSVSEKDKYPAIQVSNQSSLRKTVRLERRMELANESTRYMDLIRWRLAEKALNTKVYGLLYPASDLIDKVTAKGLWFWPTTPTLDDDGIADFSKMENAGQIMVLSKRVWDNRQYLWPIPTSEVEVSPNLKQNPGY